MEIIPINKEFDAAMANGHTSADTGTAGPGFDLQMPSRSVKSAEGALVSDGSPATGEARAALSDGLLSRSETPGKRLAVDQGQAPRIDARHLIPINPKAGIWGVESERHFSVYTVTGNGTGCTCPHSTFRQAPDCKHRMTVRAYLAEQTALSKAADRAANLTDEELQRWAKERNGTPEGAACLLELACRRRGAEREAQLKELFS